eukprot:3869516-Rhodomonas_salina.7
MSVNMVRIKSSAVSLGSHTANINECRPAQPADCQRSARSFRSLMAPTSVSEPDTSYHAPRPIQQSTLPFDSRRRRARRTRSR